MAPLVCFRTFKTWFYTLHPFVYKYLVSTFVMSVAICYMYDCLVHHLISSVNGCVRYLWSKTCSSRYLNRSSDLNKSQRNFVPRASNRTFFFHYYQITIETILPHYNALFFGTVDWRQCDFWFQGLYRATSRKLIVLPCKPNLSSCKSLCVQFFRSANLSTPEPLYDQLCLVWSIFT